MIINDFITTYEMHDSLILNIVLEDTKLTFTIDFFYWMQSNYKDDEIETGIIQVVFDKVTDYNGIMGQVDNYSILDVTYEDDIITFLICDDYNDTSYEISFKAKSVDVNNL